MKVVPDQKLKEVLIKNGLGKLVKGFDIDYDDYSRYMKEVEMLHPSYNSEAKHRWAAYSSIFCNKKYAKLKRPLRSSIPTWITVTVVVIVLIILAVFINRSAFAQGTSQLDFIKFEESDGTPIKTYASPFRFRCGTNFTCAASGSRITLELTSLSGLENWTRNSVSGLLYPSTLSDKVGIGKNNPAYPLDINGFIAFDTNGSKTLFLHNYNPTYCTGGNTFIGDGGLLSTSDSVFTFYGGTNTGLGSYALYSNTTGYANTALGVDALVNNTSGAANLAVGVNAGYGNTSGIYNVAIGGDSLFSNQTGWLNTAIGAGALYNVTTGYNVAIGANAGRYQSDGVSANSTGTNSIFIGNNARAYGNGETNQIVIGDAAIGLGANKAVIGNSSTTAVYRYDTRLVEADEIRTKLISNTTFYVRTDGSDSNDGSANDASHAWLTLQHSVDYIKQNVDPAGYDITVNIADGTYETSGTNLAIGPLSDIGQLTFTGNTTTPSNVLIRSTNSWTIGLEGYTGVDADQAVNGRLHFEGFKIESDTLYGIYAEATWFTFSKLDFGDCYGDHLRVKRGAVAVPIGDYTISGDARSHIFTEYFGNFVSGDSALTVTLTGTPAFSTAFIECEHMSGALINNITYSGSATGIRFIVGKFSSIYTAGQGLTYFPGDVAGIFNGGFYDEYRDLRRQLTATATYYVRTDGSDSNTCLIDSAAGACLTVQGAIDKWEALDTAGYDTTINIGNGTYTDVISLTSHTGKGDLTISGDPSTPSNVVLSTSGTTLSVTGLGLGNIVYLEGVKIASSAGNGISVASSKLYFENVEFSSISVHQMTVSDGGWIVATGNYTISAGAYTHMFAQRGGSFLPGGTIGVTISGTPAFSGAFAYSYRIGVIVYNSNYTWTGSATGTRYVASSNGIIDAAGLGTTWLPGNGAGSTSYGGQYIP